MPKPCMPRNVASTSGIDPAKLKPIPFILDSSVPEYHRQLDIVQESGDKEQKNEHETPIEVDPPKAPEKENKEKEDEHEIPLETDHTHVPDIETQAQETEKETPREESKDDVPKKNNEEAQPVCESEPSQDSAENSSRIVGHIELQSVDDFKKELEEKVVTPRFLMVHLPRYPNLLKRYQEGSVQPIKRRSQFSRLSEIKKRNVKSSEVLDLDFLAHIAVNKDSWSVEVITGSEGEQAQGTPREIPSPPDEANVPSNPVPPEEDEVPSNPLPPDQQDAQQGVYDGSTEESSEDDEDILRQRSQEKTR